MKDLQEATEQICDLKGNVLALEAFISSLINVLPWEALGVLHADLQQEQEVARTVLLSSLVSEHTRSAFERDSQRLSENLQRRIEREFPGG